MSLRNLGSKHIVCAGSFFLICAGLCGLLAWLLGWKAYLLIVHGSNFLAADTAACFVFAGIGFYAIYSGFHKVVRIIGVLLMALAAVYLGTSLSNIWFSLHALFPEKTARIVAPMPIRECHMASVTAAVFLLIGSFFVVVAKPRIERYSLNAATFLAAGIPTLGLLGAAFSLARLVDSRSWVGYVGLMSLSAAICSVVAGVCACAAFWAKAERSERRLSSAAATLSLVGLLVLFASVNSVVISDHRIAAETEKQIEAVSHQINLLREVVDSVRKAETGQQAFLLSGSDTYLGTYEIALHDIANALSALASIPAVNTATLRSLIDQKRIAWIAAIQLEQEHNHGKAVALFESNSGLPLSDAIDAESERLANILRARRSGLLARSDKASARPLETSVALSSMVAAGMIVLSIAVLRLEVRRRAKLEEELRENSRDLQKKVEERTAEIRKYSDDLTTEVGRRQEASDQLRLALNLANVVTWSWNAATGQLSWSGAVEPVYGITADNMGGYDTFRNMIHLDDRPRVDALVTSAVKHRKGFEAEFRILHPSGETRWISNRGHVICDARNRVVRVAGFDFDISARKRAEQQLAVSERHFRELAEAMPQIVWAANADGEIEYQNQRWTRVTGLPAGKSSLEERIAAMHPDDVEYAVGVRNQCIKSQCEYNVEFRLFDREKKEYRWQWAHGIPMRDEKGNVTRWYGTFTDIHERKIAELRLAESELSLRKREQQLALLFQKGLAGDYVWDLAKSEVDAHPGVWALFGEPKGSGRAPASWFTSRYHPEEAALMEREWQAAIEGGTPVDVEHRIIWPDGSVHWLSSRSITICDQNGKPAQIHGLCFDITDRKLAGLKVQESERHFHELADAMPQIVWRCTPKGDIDYCNARWFEYSGRVGTATPSLQSLVHSEDLDSYRDAWRRGLAGNQPFEFESRLHSASEDAYRWHLARFVPYRDLDGKILHWFGAATDIHEQKLSKERLEAEVARRAAAMQELEVKETQLTRSLAEKNTLFREMHHRVKNNLQVISSLLNMQSNILKDPVAANALRESHQRVLSMALIHEQLYGDLEVSRINFAEFAQNLVAELLRSYKGRDQHVTCRLNAPPIYLPITQATPLGLILNELVTNAFKYAYPPGQHGEIVISLHESEAGEVSLAVLDQGVGFPPGLDWKNSESMGLPIVDLLTQQLGGKLTVNSQCGCAITIQFLKEAEELKTVTTAA